MKALCRHVKQNKSQAAVVLGTSVLKQLESKPWSSCVVKNGQCKIMRPPSSSNNLYFSISLWQRKSESSKFLDIKKHHGTISRIFELTKRSGDMKTMEFITFHHSSSVGCWRHRFGHFAITADPSAIAGWYIQYWNGIGAGHDRTYQKKIHHPASVCI